MGGSNGATGGGLNTWNRSSPSPGGWKLKRKVSAGLVSPEASPLCLARRRLPSGCLCAHALVSQCVWSPALITPRQTGQGPPEGSFHPVSTYSRTMRCWARRFSGSRAARGSILTGGSADPRACPHCSQGRCPGAQASPSAPFPSRPFCFHPESQVHERSPEFTL